MGDRYDILLNGRVIGLIRWNGPAAYYEYEISLPAPINRTGFFTPAECFEDARELFRKHERPWLSMRQQKSN